MSFIIRPSGTEKHSDWSKTFTIGTELVDGKICVSYFRPPVNDLIHKLLDPKPGAEPHTYKPLPPNCMRLLRRVKDPPQVDVNGCTMTFESFEFVTCHLADSAEPLPSYSAVSYCWGDIPAKSHVVLGDGSYLPITAKVARILARIAVDVEYIWLDAVCINQSDIAEKALQIPLMRDIYARAKSVEIWLGNQEGIDRVFSPSAENPSNFSIEDIAMDYDSGRNNLLGSYSPYSPGKVMDLIWSPWFERAWVVQEFCFGRDHRFHFDDAILHPLFFKMILKDVKSVRFDDKARGRCQLPLPPMVSNLPKLWGLWGALKTLDDEIKMRKNGYDHGSRLEDILVDFYSLKATDPRDKVFAMLNFANPEARNDIKPDYTRHVADIYHDAMESVLFRGTNLRLMGFAGLAMPRALFKDRPNTSSWIPDLSIPPEHTVWSAEAGYRGFRATIPQAQGRGMRLICTHMWHVGEVIAKSQTTSPEDGSKPRQVTKTYEHHLSFIVPQGKKIATVTDVLPGDPSRNLAILPRLLSSAMARTKATIPTAKLESANDVREILRKTLIAENRDCLTSDPEGKGFDQLCDLVLASRRCTDKGKGKLNEKVKDESEGSETENDGIFDSSALWEDDAPAEARLYFQTMLSEGTGSTRGLFWAARTTSQKTNPPDSTDGGNDETKREKKTVGKKTKKKNKGHKKGHKKASKKKTRREKNVQKTDKTNEGTVNTPYETVGLAANGVQPGDQVWVLAGARVPFILRPLRPTEMPGFQEFFPRPPEEIGTGSGKQPPVEKESTRVFTPACLLVCEAYLHGVMHDEVEVDIDERVTLF